MANYLITHYKGTYRIMCPYDKLTNQFARKLDGTYEDIDCYIKCLKNIRIFYYGSGLLEAYIPSVRRGNNILAAMEKNEHGDIPIDIHTTDKEVYFKFKATDMPTMEQYLLPIKSCSERSPFSSCNLPKSDYKIPDEDLIVYKEAVKNLPFNRISEISHMTRSYVQSLATKNHTYDMILADMKRKMMKPREYIHSIGKWNEYVEYLKKSLK